jgi:hypothetical protein
VVIRLLDRPQDRLTLLDIRRHRFLGQDPDPPLQSWDDVLVVCGVYGGHYQDFDLLVVEHLGEGVKGVFGGGLEWKMQDEDDSERGSSASRPYESRRRRTKRNKRSLGALTGCPSSCNSLL